ncbi:helicase DnaB [Staphylococcus massiliensis CCUG 55927]|uniref:replication initiation and membrane attachment family protein n=1 Tax=Staphylococcus massiliensis TaxID=555791 RepID=UPI0002DC5417|nr:DnaD domain protein [Staphylococcus massiliensis]POA01675.1 helicase DnaB [Staphylococcus massiliensis CCUG 55927]
MSMSSYDFSLRPQDGFSVVQDFHFSHMQQNVLNRLFTPLIGPKAVGIYIYLSQFGEMMEAVPLTHYTIMNELKVNLMKFRAAMDALEGIGLIKSFVQHNQDASHFIYQLLPLPTPHQFFQDPMLSVYLYQAVEKKRYQQLKAYFTKPNEDLSAFQEITKKFTDVFEIPKDALSLDATNVQGEQKYQGVDLSELKFNFETLYDLLQHHYVSKEIVSKDIKALIIQLATLYGLNESSMKSIILKSLTSNQRISTESLRKYARSYYLMEHEKELPELKQQSYEREDSKTREQATSSEDGMAAWFELLDETSPIDMLASWSESEPTIRQKKLIEDLIEREKLPFGVINILLQYVMLKNDYTINRSYVEEIASSWKKKGLLNAEQAYEHSKNIQESQQKRKASKAKSSQKQIVSKEKTPKWLQNKKSNASKPAKGKKTLSAEEEAELEKKRQAFYKRLQENWGEDDV